MEDFNTRAKAFNKEHHASLVHLSNKYQISIQPQIGLMDLYKPEDEGKEVEGAKPKDNGGTESKKDKEKTNSKTD